MNTEITDDFIKAVAERIMDMDLLKETKQPKVGDIVVAWELSNAPPMIGVLKNIRPKSTTNYPYVVAGIGCYRIEPFNGNVEEALGL